MLEEERKYQVPATFSLPDLTAALPVGGRVVGKPTKTLVATYFDTTDLRLARSGVSLRFRQGDDEPWTVKLPADVPGVRHEISRPDGKASSKSGSKEKRRRGKGSGSLPAKAASALPDKVVDALPGKVSDALPGKGASSDRGADSGTGASSGKGAKRPPVELTDLVTAYSHGAKLTPVTVVRSVRTAYELRDADDQVLAEVDDDTVSVLDGDRVTAEFREIEVERKTGERALLEAVETVLLEAGATTGVFIAKHRRALGAAASAEPDLVPPGELPGGPTAGDVVTFAVRDGVRRILTHDPLVRLREPLPGGDTAVHQMRVGCRRLRSDLRTFGALVDSAWARPIRAELGWLAGALGAARDAEVLRERLRQTANADPLSPVDLAAVDRMDAVLRRRHDDALDQLDTALRTDRYRALVQTLVSAAREPALSDSAQAPAETTLPALVSKPWRQLAEGGKGVAGAAALKPDEPDAKWHAVRINGKRARYAVEAVAPVLGGPAAKLGKALAKVQTLLGEHQDAAMAGETWLAIAGELPDDHDVAVTAGRLFERERAIIHQVRGEFPEAWTTAERPKTTHWLQ